jgi:integrase/recombinase XerD
MAEQLVLPGVSGDRQVSTDESQAAIAPRRLTSRSSLPSAVGAFEAHMRGQDFAENTCKAFVSDLNLLVQFTGVGQAVGDVATPDLRRFTHWLAHERDAPCSPKTLARRVTAIKVFFAWLADAGVLGTDPAAAVIHQPARSPLPRILSDAEINRVLDVTQALRTAGKPDARPHLLVTLLLHTGIKKGECMNIILNHLDFTDPARPVLWVRYNNPRRRHKERPLDLPAAWQATLAEYLAQYRPDSELFPWTARNLEYVLAAVGESADLPSQLSFSTLRWTSAVRDYRSGMSPEGLRQKLGISNITWRDVGEKVSRLATAGRSA